MDGEDPMQIPAILNFLESEMEKILSGEKEETKVNTKTRNDEKISHLSKKSAEEIIQKIKETKEKLISITSSEEFKNFMRPILAFRNTSKQKFSFHNSILIWLQDPEATFVQSIGNWDKKYNREVTDSAKILTLCVRSDQKIKERIRKKNDEEDVDEPDDEEPMFKEKTIMKFKYVHSFTDVRFTKVKEGKEDVLSDYDQGSKNIKELVWHTDGTTDEELITLINAVEMVCKDEGINIEKVQKDALNGALGVST